MTADGVTGELSAARGYQTIGQREGIASLRAALALDLPHILIGLDMTRPWPASRLTGPTRALAHLVVRAAPHDPSGPGGPARRDALREALDDLEPTMADRFGTDTPAARQVSASPSDADAQAADGLVEGAGDTQGDAGAGNSSVGGGGSGSADGTGTQARTARVRLERIIAAAWCEVLGIGQVGVHDNFFDIGGNSVAATRLHSLLESRLPQPPSMVDLFRCPSVRTLANHLSAVATARAVTAGGPATGASAADGTPTADATEAEPAPTAAGERGRQRAERRLAARRGTRP